MEIKKIHEDDRGSIFSITGPELNGIPELSILKTNAGYCRGGCVHRKSFEHLVVLKGQIDYHYKLPVEMEERIQPLYEGQQITIAPNTTHYIDSINDSIIMEFGPHPDEKKEKDPQFRKIVDEHNKSI